MKKVVNYQDLPGLIKQIKLTGQDLVLVGGCFDILHLGHIRFLKETKKYGTVVVALESDAALKRLKGLARPIHKQFERAEVLSDLKTVDYVVLLPEFKKDSDYAKLTQTVSPDFIGVTAGDPKISQKQIQAKKAGAKLIIVPKITTPSTSQLVKLLKLN